MGDLAAVGISFGTHSKEDASGRGGLDSLGQKSSPEMPRTAALLSRVVGSKRYGLLPFMKIILGLSLLIACKKLSCSLLRIYYLLLLVRRQIGVHHTIFLIDVMLCAWPL